MKYSPLKTLLLAAAAVSTFAAPTLAAAQPQGRADRTEAQEAREKRAETRQERQARAKAAAERRAEAAARKRPDVQRPDRPAARPDRPGAQRPDRPAARPDRPAARPDRPDRGDSRPDRVDRGPRGERVSPERVRSRQQARNTIRRNWNRDSWRSRWHRSKPRNWWRSHSWWRGWNGVRVGFFFAPGYGYYSVPRNYWNVRYYEGMYLPSIFWRYRVIDPYFYGLPPAPPGTVWVYYNNSILLIDRYDGYIIEVIYDVWYW